MPVPSLSLAWFCLAAAVTCAAITAAALGAVAILARRVADLNAELTDLDLTRPACPDRPRIDALEQYARGPAGRHGRPQQPDGRVPRTRWGRPPQPQPPPRTHPGGLLAAPPRDPPPPLGWPPR